MPGVTLIFTVHAEVGLANASELNAILHQVKPQVIFLEVPTAAFDEFYSSRTRRNLESDAVLLFLESSPGVKLIPVDLPTPAQDFFEDHIELCMRMQDASREYRQLARIDHDRQKVYGFAYLNSDYCDQHWADMRKVIVGTLERIGDPRLTEVQDLWDRTNQLRELEMLENVLHYCQLNQFERAAFLVGAAHRRSLTEKLQAQGEISWSKWEYRSDT